MRTLLFLFALVVMSFSGVSRSDARERYSFEDTGVEECLSHSRELYIVGHQVLGVEWKVRFKNTEHIASTIEMFANLMKGKGFRDEVLEFTAEQPIKIRCEENKLIERESLRSIVLYDKNGTVIFEGEVYCKGYPPNGIETVIPHFSWCAE